MAVRAKRLASSRAMASGLSGAMDESTMLPPALAARLAA
jgi:hypothetical protein